MQVRVILSLVVLTYVVFRSDRGSPSKEHGSTETWCYVERVRTFHLLPQAPEVDTPDLGVVDDFEEFSLPPPEKVWT